MENDPSIRYLVDSIPEEWSIEVPEGASLRLCLASLEKAGSTRLTVNVHKDAAFEGVFADLSSGDSSCLVDIHLLEEGANCSWHLSAVSKEKGKKTHIVSAYHHVPHTKALVSNYGIALDSSRLSFSGTSEIVKGAKGSETVQKAKIIVFDAKADGKASPILKIAENDVIANHAAVVGRLNDQHLYYLESRGISHEEAKRLIALGYLSPILPFFEDESLREKIEKTIGEGL